MNETGGTVRVLAVTTDPGFADWAETAEGVGDRLTVTTARRVCEGEDLLADADVDCVVADYDLPDGDGVAFLTAVREIHPDLPFLLFPEAGSEAVASEAISAGVTDYVRDTGEAEQYRRLADRIDDVVTDRADRAERRRELELGQQRFQALTENTTFAVLTIDEDSVVRYANDALEEVLGYQPGELVGESLLELMPDRFHDEHLAAVERYLDTDTRTLDWEWVELPGRHREGHEVPLGVSFGETTIEGDRRFTAIIRDVTDRAERERERVETIDFLQDLYDVTTDADVAFEEKMARLLDLGCDRLGLPYGFLSKIEPAEDDENGVQRVVHAQGDHELLQPGESCPLSKAYCRKTIETDGVLAVADAVEEGWADDEAYQLFELGCYIGGKVRIDGELYGTLCFAATDPSPDPLTDTDRTLVRLMSRWVSYELERAENRRELRRQNDRLDQFASVVSHDLRNPLNVANLHLEIAAEEPDSDSLDEVADALERMDDIIEDALLFAREGKAVEETAVVALSALAERCWDTCVTDDGDLAVADDLAFEADPDRLARLLENLFRNALEHNPGAVTVTVGPLEDDGFFVADDGEGIPPEDAEEVFVSGYSTSDEGTGLGLAIVNETAQAHGWTVDLGESERGGTRFEFRGVTVRSRD